jgi:meiotically up-regulated gene 157 (Mug157) protein
VKEKYFPTGNEYIALPTIRETDAAIEQVNVLHMGVNGLLSFSGGTAPFLTPRITVNDEEVMLGGRLSWEREGDWLPKFRLKEGPLEIEGLYFCPPEEKGFVLSLRVSNLSDSPFYCGLSADISWSALLHSINVTKPLKGDRFLVAKTWEDMPALEFRSPAPLLSLAPYPPDKSSRFFFRKGLQALNPAGRETSLEGNESLLLHWLQSKEVKKGEVWQCYFYFGLGLDEIGAFAAARELQRKGGKVLRQQTVNWLGEKRRVTKTKDPQLDSMMNLNAFFNRFYATGMTIDTEEVVCLTSRSNRYYVSGAYWDRDTLLWSFPSILALDPEWARKVLGYAFATQGKNFGTHSRYLNGAILEQGFELDQLCAPIIALRNYLEATKDTGFLSRPGVRESLERFEKELAQKKHPKKDLYQTWLLPSDDPWPQRYVTYDNVLVWRTLMDLAQIYRMEKNKLLSVKIIRLQRQAGLVKAAVIRYCVTKGPKGRMFAWSVDLDVKNSHKLYDEPPGSLLLLPYYGFCKLSYPLWKRSRDWIYSADYPYSFTGKPFEETGCAHAPHPWVLASVNSLLAGQKDRALHFLKRATMDNGIACESVDENTGESATGDAFATCAGFLAYGLWHVLGKKLKVKKRW